MDFIRKRQDVTFSLLTKRANRIKECLPSDWGEGWDNVTIAVSVENQKRADERIPFLLAVPTKHLWISVKPFIGEVNLDKYLATGRIETVLAGGENYMGLRPLYYDWVKSLHNQCVKYNVQLIFGQTGNVFVKDNKVYKIRNRTDQMIQAVKSGLNYPEIDIVERIEEIESIREVKK